MTRGLGSGLVSELLRCRVPACIMVTACALVWRGQMQGSSIRKSRSAKPANQAHHERSSLSKWGHARVASGAAPWQQDYLFSPGGSDGRQRSACSTASQAHTGGVTHTGGVRSNIQTSPGSGLVSEPLLPESYRPPQSTLRSR